MVRGVTDGSQWFASAKCRIRCLILILNALQYPF